MLGARAVVGFLVGEFAQGGEVRGGGLLAGGQRGVDLGDAAADEGQGVRVDGEVVDALVPPVQSVVDAEEGLGDERAAGEVHGAVEVGAHPGLGLGPGVAGGAQVDPVERQFRFGDDALGGDGVLVGGAGRDGEEGEGLRLGGGAEQGALEELRVQGAPDLHAVARVVDGVVRGEFLGVQDSGLGGEQGKLGLIGLGLVVTHGVGTPVVGQRSGHTGTPRYVSLGKPKLFSAYP